MSKNQLLFDIYIIGLDKKIKRSFLICKTYNTKEESIIKSFRKYLKEKLKDPKFKREWDKLKSEDEKEKKTMKLTGDLMISKEGIVGYANIEFERGDSGFDFNEDKTRLFDIKFNNTFKLRELFEILDFEEIDSITVNVETVGEEAAERTFFYELQGNTPKEKLAELDTLNDIEIDLKYDDHIEIFDGDEIIVNIFNCDEPIWNKIVDFFNVHITDA